MRADTAGARSVKVTSKQPKNRKLEMDAPPLFFDRKLELEGQADIRQALADAATLPTIRSLRGTSPTGIGPISPGAGLVEPIDDVRATNPPSIPLLLDALARDFTEHGYDVKHMLRTICNSSVYQRALRVTPGEGENPQFYTHRAPRRLPAEALLDAAEWRPVPPTFTKVFPKEREPSRCLIYLQREVVLLGSVRPPGPQQRLRVCPQRHARPIAGPAPCERHVLARQDREPPARARLLLGFG